jgi:hypothetical protein
MTMSSAPSSFATSRMSGRCGRPGGRDNLPAHAPPGVLQLANDAVDQLRGFFLRLEDRVDGPGELVLAYVKHDHLAPDSRPISPATLAALRCAPIRPPQEGSCRTWHPPFSIHSGVRIAPFAGAEGPPDHKPSAPRCVGNRRSLGGRETKQHLAGAVAITYSRWICSSENSCLR